MNIFTELIWLLGNIIWKYVSEGWLFFGAHLYILYILYKKTWLVRMRQEIAALEAWRPYGPVAPAGPDSAEIAAASNAVSANTTTATETTKILNEYVTECEKLGSQGLFIPMTDYSDRLDSIVDGMISELHDRTNLFLVVGIAGTLFGLFEFALNAYQELQAGDGGASNPVLKLGEHLSGSMAKAFPVGFMGLTFTLVAQIWSTGREEELRVALSGATRRALERREKVSVSQAEVVRQASSVIQSSMEPLKDLRTTLTDTIQPVVKSFGMRLDEALRLIRDQVGHLQQTTGGLQIAIIEMQNGVNMLGKTAVGMGGLFKLVPQVLSDLSQMQSEQKEASRILYQSQDQQAAQLRQLGDRLDQTVVKLSDLPERLSENFKSSFEILGTQALDSWQKMSGGFNDNLQREYVNYIEALRVKVDEISDNLLKAGKEWERIGQNATAILQQPILDLVNELRSTISGDLRSLERTLATRYPTIIQDLDNFAERLGDSVGKTRQIQDTLDAWLLNATRAQAQLTEMQSAFGEISARLRDGQASALDGKLVELMTGNQSELKSIGERISDIGKNLPRSGDGVAGELQQANRSLEKILENVKRRRLLDRFRRS
jgi:Mg2+ and Co2+ transporter CorA